MSELGNPFDEQNGAYWFVYALLLTDCTAFKIGFSCNPLQRIYTFHRRYYEAFDLDRSLLLRLPTCDDARAIEAAVKQALAPNRVDVPSWIATDAGGFTEWFSAVYFDDAALRLQQDDGSDSAALFDLRSYLQKVLAKSKAKFELWTLEQLQYIELLTRSRKTLDAAREQQRRLYDWLDAYRWLQIDVFEDRPEVRSVLEQLRSSKVL